MTKPYNYNGIFKNLCPEKGKTVFLKKQTHYLPKGKKKKKKGTCLRSHEKQDESDWLQTNPHDLPQWHYIYHQIGSTYLASSVES